MSGDQDYVLEARHVSRRFPARAGRDVVACDDVSLGFRQGAAVGLVGESGCGKSTLMRMMVALDRPTSGEVVYRGRDITKLKGEQLRQVRQHVQMVFQDPTLSMNPRMRVRDIVCEPLLNFGRIGRREAEAAACELLEMVGLPAELAGRYPHAMSGGQRQRVAIARAVALRPQVVILDEATSALDVSVQKSIIQLVGRMQRELNLAVGFVCHDLGLVSACCDQVAVMYGGRIVETFPVADIERAAHPYTHMLLEAVFDTKMDFAKKITPAEPEMRGVRGARGAYETICGCPFQGRCAQRTDLCCEKRPELTAIGPEHCVACHLVAGKAHA